MRISGSRVDLSLLTAEDLEFVRELRNRPENARQFFSQRPITRAEQQVWFAGVQERDDEFNFMIQGDAGERLGIMALYNIDRRHDMAEFGRLILATEARGRGLAREAIQLLLDHAFGPLRLHRVYLEVFADNPAPRRLYGSVGFREEGVRREAFRQAPGEYRDIVMMGILESEWP